MPGREQVLDLDISIAVTHNNYACQGTVELPRSMTLHAEQLPQLKLVCNECGRVEIRYLTIYE